MEKQVWFHLHSHSPEITVKIMTKILEKYKFLKVFLHDNRCIISSVDVPDSLNSWIIEKILNSKRFMGRYHPAHNLYTHPTTQKRIRIAQGRMQACMSRFGFWDSIDYPEEKVFGEFLVRKTQYLLMKKPLWQAIKLSLQETSHILATLEGKWAISFKIDLYKDMVKYHEHSKEEALTIIHREFPYLENFPIRMPVEDNEISKEVIQTIQKKTHDLIQTLKFYSPKQRKSYLEKSENFDKYLIFVALFHRNGKEWIVENIGEIESWT